MDNAGAKNLIIAIITTAITDVKDDALNIKTSRNKRSAIRFLKSEDCKFYCECLDIDHNCIRDFLKNRQDLKKVRG